MIKIKIVFNNWTSIEMDSNDDLERLAKYMRDKSVAIGGDNIINYGEVTHILVI